MRLIHAIRFLIPVAFGSLLLIVTSISTIGQEMPPRPIEVSVNLSQQLSFGAFYQGAFGGTVIIYPNGSRASTGDVVLLSLGYIFSSGLYDVYGNPGTVVSILNMPDAILTGSNGGTITVHIGDTYPQSPFVLNGDYPSATQLRVGGTLILGNPLDNPPGNYSGTYDLTFIRE